jgi:hypothetical protein
MQLFRERDDAECSHPSNQYFRGKLGWITTVSRYMQRIYQRYAQFPVHRELKGAASRFTCLNTRHAYQSVFGGTVGETKMDSVR